MITRIGHMAFRVRDLDASVEFLHDTLGLVETERHAGVSYLTCNERHHELMLISDQRRTGYDHVGLEVENETALQEASTLVTRAGGEIIGAIYDGEPGIDRALRVLAPGGHVFKLFIGMHRAESPASDDRPLKFEHVSLKTTRPRLLEAFLRDGLGFRLSDRMGRVASWWHCDEDHHGMAVTFGPRSELHHYAWTMRDLNAIGRVADRLQRNRDQRLVWGPSRHGPGNNMFAYFHDHDQAMIELCADIARMTDYAPHTWPSGSKTLNLWGGPPPPRFILTGTQPVAPQASKSAYATQSADRAAAA